MLYSRVPYIWYHENPLLRAEETPFRRCPRLCYIYAMALFLCFSPITVARPLFVGGLLVDIWDELCIFVLPSVGIYKSTVT